MKNLLFLLFLAFISVIPAATGWAQKPSGSGTIRKLVIEKKNLEAQLKLHEDLNIFLKENKTDSLITYLKLIPEVYNSDREHEKLLSEINSLVEKVATSKAGNEQKCKVYINGGEILDKMGQSEAAIRLLERANFYAAKSGLQKPNLTTIIQERLGKIKLFSGDIPGAKTNYFNALRLLSSENKNSHEDFYDVYAGTGTIMFYASKYDSAVYFYTKALEAIAKAPKTPETTLFLPANVKNNLALVYGQQGKMSDNISTTLEAINLYQTYIRATAYTTEKDAALKNWFKCLDNLAGSYRYLKNYKKAEQFLLFSYKQKLNQFGVNHPGTHISEILLGQHYNYIGDYSRSLTYSYAGFNGITQIEPNNQMWAGNALRVLANNYETINQMDSAATYYKKAAQALAIAYGNIFDFSYIEFLLEEAMFKVKQGDFDLATKLLKTVGVYIQKNGEDDNLQGLDYKLREANIYLTAQKFQNSLKASEQALELITQLNAQSENGVDRITLDALAAIAITAHSKASYQLLPKKDTGSLIKLMDRLDSAFVLIEKTNNYTYDREDIGLLLNDNKDLLTFYSQLALELYKLTNSKKYLELFIRSRENIFYNKIRNRLNQEQALAFSDIPDSILQKEKLLKEKLNASLNPQTASTTYHFENYTNTNQEWEQYLSVIKKDYPKYYQLRYAPLIQSANGALLSIPKNTTLVRYYFVADSLIALVSNAENAMLITLNSSHLKENLLLAVDGSHKEEVVLTALNNLYMQIWAPIATQIKTQKVLVIPDGMLHSLNMEMLVVQPAKSFEAFKTQSLLNQHTFSYHYSLFVLQNEQKSIPEKWNKNFVGFAPLFSDDLKKEYIETVKDSLNIDYTYLNLLPQPRTYSAVNEMRDLIGGLIFSKNASTKAKFIEQADKSKIIYLATHGEYNNAVPELSGLVFAKELNDSSENFLPLNEVYEHAFNTNLLMLTACETGKAGFRDGEGMVSLAHAFNYAGSKSILTGLWKIDEASTADITEQFVIALKEGLPLDEALRKAKLTYLKTANGRMLHPQYWAGLVIIGDTTPIHLNTPISKWWYIGTGLVLILGFTFYYVRKRKAA